ncbi:hypothetical protein QMK19_03405 [Streptomyces sp. H10-C2]|uniref:hypothetical protein n=1 Tax=unclassified Streptomyces TaxID=2593676 RepID=UPI0024B8F60F|nr:MULTISPECIES: hypothetical protein [unclassified Streptomyces]MDJ0342233.1 hypothetical protein [Streptomyces sp. PH10-H1]MDJ0368747.1 hypothetical protein [Streptomyces sp. H10-C2]
MIRETRFLISHKSFAVDLSTLTGEQHERGDRIAYSGHVSAVWFRRKDGTTRACLGTLKLWSHYLPAPLDLTDPRAVLAADMDGRYGGDCHGRWDGERYWGAQEPFTMALHLTLLEPMLDNYPAIPEDHDGWWRF